MKMKIKLNFNLHAHLSLIFFLNYCHAMIAKDKQKMNYGFIKRVFALWIYLSIGIIFNNITFDNNNIT